ncbi:MAG: hypothetical protein TREMPRED_000920 [Tremellales sp. Tagirdzhanova-0007]|nr:MAG: hypothetical protein TREMPRED_000920 [Tremellales sp. Tagirdzhanova-0007]
MTPRCLLTPAWQRRLAKAASHRPPAPSRFIQADSALPIGKNNLAPREVPHPASLSALLSRLSLPSNPGLHSALIACLTHPSYLSSQEETNEILCSVGNSLLGLFASEHLSHLYPLLPTEALKSAVTAYVGPKACVSVARELGVAVQAGGNMGQPQQGQGMPSAGLALRWRKRVERSAEPEKTPVAKRFRKYSAEDESAGEQVDEAWHRLRKKDSFEEVVATSVKAFIGLIYQEQGIHAARTFVHAFFLTRHLDLASLFNFKNPVHVLSSVVARHLIEAGVHPSKGTGRIEARLLASTGAQTQSPVFNVGVFTAFGLKLGEGHGSSVQMAEHRASVNALLAHFLVRGDQGHQAGPVPVPSGRLPTTEKALRELHSEEERQL